MAGFNKRWIYGALLLLLPVVFSAWCFYQFTHVSLSDTQRLPASIRLPAGVGAGYVLDKLHRQGLIRHPLFYKPFAYTKTYHQHLKTGEYAIVPNKSLSDLLQTMLEGKVLIRQFTLVEGWRYRDLRLALQKAPYLKHTILHLRNDDLKKRLGVSNQSLEGLFFPDTYFYTWGESDIDILSQALVKMQVVLAENWQHRQAALPYQNPYQALIVASLIEKETALAHERGLVASVISNRLRKKMRLQIDAAVLYGLTVEKNRLSHQDLAKDSAYNTYLRLGLPPTPIALPGEAAIYAALHPIASHYLYYVAKGDGNHVFSENYQQHLSAVKHYRKASG